MKRKNNIGVVLHAKLDKSVRNINQEKKFEMTIKKTFMKAVLAAFP
jgi:hypothetical protein